MGDIRTIVEEYAEASKEAARLARKVMPFVIGAGIQKPTGNLIVGMEDDVIVLIDNDRFAITLSHDEEFVRISLRSDEGISLSTNDEESGLKLVKWAIVVLQRLSDTADSCPYTTMHYSTFLQWIANESYGLKSLDSNTVVQYDDDIYVIRPVCLSDNKIATVGVSQKVNGTVHRFSLDIVEKDNHVLRINGVPFIITEYTFIKLVYIIQFIVNRYVNAKCNALNAARSIVMSFDHAG